MKKISTTYTAKLTHAGWTVSEASFLCLTNDLVTG